MSHLPNISSELKKSMEFIIEIDKLKSIMRQTKIMTGERDENSAEHSWHLAMMLISLSEYSIEKIDILSALKMALIHDVVEIDAGDCFVYDEEARAQKQELELAAADRIFGLLPSEIGTELKTLWQRYEDSDCPESRFVHALDRIQPLMCNYLTQGHSWKKHRIQRSQVEEINKKWRSSAPKLAEMIDSILNEAQALDYFPEVGETNE